MRTSTAALGLAVLSLALAASAAAPPPHTGLPKRYTGLDAQGHLPSYLADACHGHVAEVIAYPDGNFLITCLPATLTTGEKRA